MKIKVIRENETIEITGEKIFSCEISEYCDLISNEIASNTATIRLKASLDFITFNKGDKIQIIGNHNESLGYFYIENAKMTDLIIATNEYMYDITANDIIYKLDDYEYLGEYYSASGNDDKLINVLARIFMPLNITVIIPTALQNLSLYGYNPAGTVRQALQYICFTNNLTVNTARIDGIELKIEDTIVGTVVNYDEVFSSNIDINDAVTGVSATAYQFIYPADDADADTLFDGVFPDYDLGEDTKTLTYEPHQGFIIENGQFVDEEGEPTTLTSKNICYCHIKANNGTDKVTVTARPYIKAQTSYTQGDRKNPVNISDNTMINILNVNSLVSGVFNYYSNTHIGNIDMLYKGNIPGDRIAVYTKFGVVYGRISEQKIVITQSLERAKIKLEGSLLPAQEVYFTPNELKTGDIIPVL